MIALGRRTTTLLTGDALDVLPTLPSCSVQTCVTSPPYYGLRDYGVSGQIGLEESPEAYIEKLVQVFREVRRVLKDDGTLFLNLGDSYWGGKTGRGDTDYNQRSAGGIYRPGRVPENNNPSGAPFVKQRPVPVGAKPKDLLMIPARVALALQADGWYLRSEIIWHKPNPMPESVRDRPTKAHEMIYLLAKSQKYFYDAEAIKEPAAYDGRKDTTVKPSDKYAGRNMVQGQQPQKLGRGLEQERWPSKLDDGTPARNRRDVWTIVTRPYKDAHFATFPPDLIEPCILAGTSARGECPKCGRAWVRMTKRVGANVSNEEKIKEYQDKGVPRTTANLYATKERGHAETVGWRPSCSCVDESDHNGPFEPVPQMVLDPFNGSGTTGAVAVMHGRNYIGIELNPAYVELSQKRINGVQIEAAL